MVRINEVDCIESLMIANESKITIFGSHHALGTSTLDVIQLQFSVSGI